MSAVDPSPTWRHVRFLVAIRGTADVKDIEFCPTLGGLAVGNQDFAETMTFVGPTTTAAGASNPVKAGWTAGGGIEYAFTNQMTVKIEYLYLDLGSVSF